MAKILLIANYKPSVGGISGQIEISLEYFNDNINQIDLFNTKDNILKRILMPFVLFIKGRKYDIFHIHGCSFFGFFPGRYWVQELTLNEVLKEYKNKIQLK
ncbi:MAG TPA: hypothetical protein PLE59_06995 [Bacteroidales bacterium]|nr:hypothetical protein [Bacteroidales bacterium]HPL03244.1 hypothetical protein [Bacteroidales bacterium]